MAAAAWRDGWIAWRNRRLSDPGFQRWAAEFPLSRPIARRRAQQLFDLVSGFVYSQVLSTCVQLGLIEMLAEGPQTVAVLAERTALPAEGAERLLAAASALGLADRASAGRYALGPQGAALLGNAGLTEMIAHHRLLYTDLADCAGLLRGGGGQGDLAGYWPYATAAEPRGAAAGQVGAYSALMAATQPTVAADILHAYPVGRHRRLLDVGGGEGAFLAAAAAHAPHLSLMLFDLPAVTERARGRLGQAVVLERTEILAGDFLADAIPQGADLITLIRILHDHDEAGMATLLRKARQALPPDGALLIAEPMSAAPASDRIADAYFGFYLFAMGRGRLRTPAAIMGALGQAGFSRVRVLRTRNPLLLRVIVAQP